MSIVELEQVNVNCQGFAQLFNDLCSFGDLLCFISCDHFNPSRLILENNISNFPKYFPKSQWSPFLLKVRLLEK